MKVFKLSKDAKVPVRANKTDAGLDLYAAETVEIKAGKGEMIGTKLVIAIPTGTTGMICDRSSMGVKGFKVHGGIIDEYRGEVKVVLWNHSGTDQTINQGDKIAQLLIVPLLFPDPEEVPSFDDLPPTTRGSNGFGSTGTK